MTQAHLKNAGDTAGPSDQQRTKQMSLLSFFGAPLKASGFSATRGCRKRGAKQALDADTQTTYSQGSPSSISTESSAVPSFVLGSSIAECKIDVKGEVESSSAKPSNLQDNVIAAESSSESDVAFGQSVDNGSILKPGSENVCGSSLEIPSDFDDDDGSSNEESSSDESDNESLPSENIQNEGLSEYELFRLRNIERNNARLAALGLLKYGSSTLNANRDFADQRRKKVENSRKRSKQRKTAGETVATAAMPTRRSARVLVAMMRNSSDFVKLPESSAAYSQDAMPQKNQEESKDEYTVSPVVEYAINETVEPTENDVSPSKTDTPFGDEKLLSLKPAGQRLMPPTSLGSIYSLQFYPAQWGNVGPSDSKERWIVGAGKAGIVSLWDCTQTGATAVDVEGVHPLLSWKAHSGRWVADAKFLPPSSTDEATNRPSKLLTAANDGSVCCWDLTAVSVANGAPKMLCRTGKELHTSGIFSMDVALSGSEVHVCTGSKDKTVAVTLLNSIGMVARSEPVWCCDYHTAKVGSVSLRGNYSTLLASASDDGRVAIHDFRVREVVAEFTRAHTRPHSVSWAPEDSVIVTAGHDEHIKTFDLRKHEQPLSTYSGHVPLNTRRCKKIHHPVFYSPFPGSSYIISGGEGSRSLSLFEQRVCTDAGEIVPVYSRGKLPEGCGDAGALATQEQCVAVAVDGGEVLILSPDSG